MTYYVMLPIFKFELTCNKLLGWIFETFFSPFWNGKIKIRKD